MQIQFRLDDSSTLLRAQNNCKIVAEVVVERPQAMDEETVQALMNDMTEALQRSASGIQRSSLERWADEHVQHHLITWPDPVDEVRHLLPELVRDAAVSCYVVVAIDASLVDQSSVGAPEQ